MRLKIFFTILITSLFLTSCVISGVETKEPTVEQPTVETPTVEETIPTVTPTPEATLTEIYVANLDKFYVSVGDTFNTRSLIIMAKYSDGETVNISNEVEFTTISTSTPGKKQITASYQGLSIKVEVNVLNPIGIEVDYEKAKVEYNVGESIDLSDLFIFNVFDNNLKLDVQEYTISIKKSTGEVVGVTENFNEAGTYVVSITSKGYQSSYEINVIDENAPTIEYTSINWDFTSVKKDFRNEEFSYEGLALYAVKSDGTRERIPASDYTAELVSGSFTVDGEYTVKVTYTGPINFANKENTYKVNYC